MSTWTPLYYGVSHLHSDKFPGGWATVTVWAAFTEAGIYDKRACRWIREKTFHGKDHERKAREWSERIALDLLGEIEP